MEEVWMTATGKLFVYHGIEYWIKFQEEDTWEGPFRNVLKFLGCEYLGEL